MGMAVLNPALSCDREFLAEYTPHELRLLLGKKGAALWRLSEWQLPVPAFCCVTSSALLATLTANHQYALLNWLKEPHQPLPFDLSLVKKKLQGCQLPDTVAADIEAFINMNAQDQFVLRSSVVLENDSIRVEGGGASHAGGNDLPNPAMFITEFNVTDHHQAIEAIKNIWCSLFESHIQQFIQSDQQSPFKANHVGMAVVIQQLIPAKKSGVLYSVDPLKGRDTVMRIEACLGVSETHQSGYSQTDKYCYDWFLEQETDRVIAHKEARILRIGESPFYETQLVPQDIATSATLSETDVTELVEMATMVQSELGYPVVIDWAFYDSQFFILQTRPQMAFHFSGLRSSWTVANFYGGGMPPTLCTPYIASLSKRIVEHSVLSFSQLVGMSGSINHVDRSADWQRTFFGHAYWNKGALVDFLTTLPDVREWLLTGTLNAHLDSHLAKDSVVDKATRKRYAQWRVSKRFRRSGRKQLKNIPEFYAQQKKRLHRLSRTNIADMTTSKLLSTYEAFLTQDYFDNEVAYFSFVFHHIALDALFKKTLFDRGFDLSRYSELLAGIGTISHLEPVHDLWNIRDSIMSSPDTLDYWLSTDAMTIADVLSDSQDNVIFDQIRIYLLQHGHHARVELDLLSPRFSERPDQVVEQLQYILRQPNDVDPRLRVRSERKQFDQIAPDFMASLTVLQRQYLHQFTQDMRDFLWWRQELRDLSTRFQSYARQLTLAVAERLCDHQKLSRVDDIFFLDFNDVRKLIRNEIPPEALRDVLQKNKCYYASFRHFNVPTQIGAVVSDPSKGEEIPPRKDFTVAPSLYRYRQSVLARPIGEFELMGTAASHGVIRAPAHVVTTFSQLADLPEGHIAVMESIDPGWTHLLIPLGGVVVETGGVLSHGALVCREYGIPAVFGIIGATQLIFDGETITVSGSQGLVKVDEDSTTPDLYYKPSLSSN